MEILTEEEELAIAIADSLRTAEAEGAIVAASPSAPNLVDLEETDPDIAAAIAASKKDLEEKAFTEKMQFGLSEEEAVKYAMSLASLDEEMSQQFHRKTPKTLDLEIRNLEGSELDRESNLYALIRLAKSKNYEAKWYLCKLHFDAIEQKNLLPQDFKPLPLTQIFEIVLDIFHQEGCSIEKEAILSHVTRCFSKPQEIEKIFAEQKKDSIMAECLNLIFPDYLTSPKSTFHEKPQHQFEEKNRPLKENPSTNEYNDLFEL